MAKQTKREDQENNLNKKNTKSRKYSRNSNRARSKNSYKSSDLDQPTNDPSWYAASPQLLSDAASIPFSWATGSEINLQAKDNAFSDGLERIPGIITLQLAPSVGYSHVNTDPINMAMFQEYAYIRHANSGSANYDAPDLMLYMLGMGSVYSYLTFLMRVYGTAMVYATSNRYMPRTLTIAQGVDFDSVNNNLANFRYGINMLINKAASFAVPATMTYFNRAAYLYQNVYIESNEITDQLYMYVPYSFLKFGKDVDGAYKLVQIPFSEAAMGYNSALKPTWKTNNARWTVPELLRLGSELLDEFIGSEDLNIMSGDILKAYGDNILKLATIGDNFTIVPVYDSNFFKQFMNATPVDGVALSTAFVGQSADKGRLEHNPQVMFSSAPEKYTSIITNNDVGAVARSKFLNVFDGDTSPSSVIESTRLMINVNGFNKLAASDSYSRVACASQIRCGTEIPAQCYIYVVNPAVGAGYNDYKLATGMTFLCDNPWKQGDPITNSSFGMYSLSVLRQLRMFKYAPAVNINVLLQDKAGTGLVNYYLGTSGAFDKTAIVDPNMLEKMHEVALLSLFNVDAIARVKQ